jgi:putative Mn2+ efflux pump MntP
MSAFKLFLIAVGLSMDAFGVSICKGLASRKLTLNKCLVVGLWFGAFQALMPLIGYFLGTQLAQYIQAVDHWIAFALLFFIGANMLREAFGKQDEPVNDATDMQTMLLLSIATSIDALAVGVTFAFLNVRIVPAVVLIGITTFCISAIGVKIGNLCGAKYQKAATIAGGLILIGIGLKILLEHLGILL